MPYIPTQKEQQVLPTGELQPQRIAVDPAAFGAAAAQGLGQAAASTNDIAMRQLQIQNETARVGAENDLLQATLDLQNGNKDKGITGFRSLVGQNAIDAYPDYQQKLNDAYKDIRSGLNPAAARMFDQTAFRIIRGASDSMGAYKSQQEVVQAHTESRDRVRLAQEGALSDADDPDKWAAHLGDVQEASLAGSRTLGLGPDATEATRKADLSAVFEDRTKQLALRNPVDAAAFYHQNIGMVVPEKRYELERMLKVTTDAQYAHGDGQAAYQQATAQPQPAAPGTPPQNFKAPDLPPIDPKRIDSIVKFVKSPTPYDAEIDAAAKQYNVNPAEIKLKIAMESGGNPKAVNPSSGTAGLAQLTAATAQRLGVTDRTDPQQAIGAVARLLAEGGGTTGGDMAGADRYYYGGSVNARGPNTNQYAENTKVVRQALFGATPPAPLTAAQLEGMQGTVLDQARAMAERRRPGDPVYADQVVAEAEKSWARDLQALRGRDYNNMTTVLNAAIKGNAQSVSELPPDVQQVYSQLTPQNVESVQEVLRRNIRAANGEYTPSNPKLVNDLREKINLPAGDPNRLTDPSQITPYIAHGLSYTDSQRLIEQMKAVNSPADSPFLRQVNQIKTTARRMLLSSPQAMAHDDLGEEAAYRFGLDLDQRITDYRNAKKDPSSLFVPSSPDYVLAPSRVQSFMPTPAEILARGAGKGTPPATTYPTATNPKTGQKLVFKDGSWQAP